MRHAQAVEWQHEPLRQCDMVAGLQWVRSDNVTPLLQVAISLIGQSTLFPLAIQDATHLLLVPKCAREQRTFQGPPMVGRHNRIPRLVRD